uniref:Uncharacterized protein n=2 Tax=viral metagenome TaxID=1070528 RepID=A0A6M3KET3_9ZZZZ
MKMEEKETKSAQVPALVEFDASVRAMMPRNFEGLWRMATIMAKSGMMPRGIEQPETVFVAVQMGLEVGLPPMAAVQNIAVINGRPSIWGDAVLGLVRASGLLESFKESFSGTFPGDDYKAVCAAKRKGDPEPIEREFSVADAKRAGLWQTEARVTRRRKDGGTYETDNDVPWFKYPKRMLQMRARSWALRDGFGDVLRGLQVREEMRDVTPMERAADGVYEAKEDGPPLSEKIKGLKTDGAEISKDAKPRAVEDLKKNGTATPDPNNPVPTYEPIPAAGVRGKKPDHVAIDNMKPENPTEDRLPDVGANEKKPPATLTAREYIDFFGAKGVPVAAIEKRVGGVNVLDWTQHEILLLKGLKSMVDTQGADARKLFGVPDQQKTEIVTEKLYPTGPEDATDGFFLAEFINLRTAGFSTYVHKNKDRLRDAPENVKNAAREKWEKFYPEAPWPILDDSPDPDNVVLTGLREDWTNCSRINSEIVQQILTEDGEPETEADHRKALVKFDNYIDAMNA